MLKHLPGFLLLLTTFLLNSCNDSIFGWHEYTAPELHDFSPIGEQENLILLKWDYTGTVVAFDPVKEEVLNTYKFPNRMLMQLLSNPKGNGFYVDLTPGNINYIDTSTGKITKVTGFNYLGYFLGHDITTDEIYISGQNELGKQTYARTIEMPGNILGEPFPIPDPWMLHNKFITDTKSGLVLTLEKEVTKSQIYYKNNEKAVDIVKDYFLSDDDYSTIDFKTQNLVNLNFNHNNESENSNIKFKLYRINSLEPVDLTLIFQMDDPYNDLFDTGDSYIVFSNDQNHDKAIRKISHSGVLEQGPIYIDNYGSSTNAVEWDGFYYIIAYDGSNILKVDSDLNMEKIEIDLD